MNLIRCFYDFCCLKCHWAFVQSLNCLSSLSQLPDGKENIMKDGWESQLDTSVLEQSRQKILQVLNSGSLKELKGLQQIGDKKAKLILGWREIHGHFTKVSRENFFNRVTPHPLVFVFPPLVFDRFSFTGSDLM